MKRNLLKVLLVGVSTLTLASCGSSNNGDSQNNSQAVAEGKEYALVTDVGDIDDHSFNQTSWEALKDFAEANSKTYAYYRPTEDSKEARVTSIKLAISKGAKVVVCPGFLFEEAIYDVQDQYPDVKFVLLDGEPHTADYKTYKTSSNTANFIYQEQVAGYLAGYAAVMDGYTKLGYCGGMAVPSVQRYATGYVQGIDAAANAKDVNVEVKFYYANQFAATPDATALMTSWYASGTEAVFACGGKVYQSVLAGAANKAESKWIGVDVDQTADDVAGKVLTSACKGLRASVTSALQLYMEQKWTEIGGQTFTLGLGSTIGSVEAKDYVEIPTANWNFATFTKEQYTALLDSIKSGSVTINGDVTAAPTVSEKTTVDYVSPFAG